MVFAGNLCFSFNVSGILMCNCDTAAYFIGATVVQEVEKTFSNQKVVSSIPCQSVLEQDTEPLIAPDVQCAISVKCKMCIYPCKSLWIKASAKWLNVMRTHARTYTHT